MGIKSSFRGCIRATIDIWREIKLETLADYILTSFLSIIVKVAVWTTYRVKIQDLHSRTQPVDQFLGFQGSSTALTANFWDPVNYLPDVVSTRGWWDPDVVSTTSWLDDVVSIKSSLDRRKLTLRETSSSSSRRIRAQTSSSSTKRIRAQLYVPLETILPHCGKTLKQAARDIKISETKLKTTIKGYGFSSWSDFRFKTRHVLSKESSHSYLTSSPHRSDVSNSSRLQVLSESDQYNSTMPVVLEAANVDQLSVNNKLFSSQFCIQSQNQSFTISPPESSSVSPSPVGAIRPISNNFELAENMNCLAVAYSEMDTTVFSPQLHKVTMQHNQAYRGTQFVSPSLDQLHTSYVDQDLFGNFDSQFGDFDAGNQVLDMSNQHNYALMPHQAENLEQSFDLSSSFIDALQEYVGTDYPLDFESRDLSVMMYTPEPTAQDVLIREVGPPVPVKVTCFDITKRFELLPCSKMEDLNREVMEKLYLGEGSFELKYLNIEDDWILIGCDADLKKCMDDFRSFKRTAVVMLVCLPPLHQNLLTN